MKNIIYLILIFCNLGMASGIDQLAIFNKNSNSISGEFTQKTINLKGFKNLSGKFSILRPKYFKWEYYYPYSQLILADGDNIWLYDNDLYQVIKQKQDGALDSSPAAILSNSNNLYKNYILLNDNNIGDIEYVKALPKFKDSIYKYIKIGMKDNLVYSIFLKDSFGNNVEITFKNIYYNKKLKIKDFKFIVPRNIDILEN